MGSILTRVGGAVLGAEIHSRDQCWILWLGVSRVLRRPHRCANMSFVVEADRREVEKVLRTESRALQQLQQPHILRMHGVDDYVIDEPMSLSLLAELSWIASLRKLLNASANRVATSSLTHVSILFGIAPGMSFIHDQKPSSVLLHNLKVTMSFCGRMVKHSFPRL